MSVGRQVCKTAIDTAADLRRYASLVAEFERGPEPDAIVGEALILARRLEALVAPILAFEGERLPQLPEVATA